MSTVSIPLRRGRRKTTLPDEPKRSAALTVLSDVFKDEFRSTVLHQINEEVSEFWMAFSEPDPWDEAVKWLERRHAPQVETFEWNWPARG